MSEKSPYPFCKLCSTNHPLGGPHAWDKPTGTKEQRMAIADAVLATRSSKGEARTRPSKPARARPATAGRKSGGRKLSVSTPPATGIDSGDSASDATPAPDKSSKMGRPRIHADRKAYLAQKARERRAAKKDKP